MGESRPCSVAGLMDTCYTFRAAIIKHASIGMVTHELNHVLEPQLIASALAETSLT